MPSVQRGSGRHEAPDGARPGERLVQLGALLFLVGVVCAVVVVVPAVASGGTASSPLVVVAGTLLPLGFAVALVGLLRGARTPRREARRAARRAQRS